MNKDMKVFKDYNWTQVEENDKYNLINDNGEYISEEWFDFISSSREGWTKVYRGNKCNLINKDGEFYFEEWPDILGEINDGWVTVKKNDKYNFIILEEGRWISPQWFDGGGYICDGHAWVTQGSKHNFINKNGEFLSEIWFDRAWNFMDNGLARVWIGDQMSYISHDGKTGKEIKYFDGRHGIADTDGNPIGYIDLYDIGEEFDGFRKVRYSIDDPLTDKWNYFDSKGNFLLENWVDLACDFRKGVGWVKDKGKWNFINKDGKYILEEWVDKLDNFEDDRWVENPGRFARIYNDGKWNITDENGRLISPEWVDEFLKFSESLAGFRKEDKWNFLDKNGNIVFDNWFDDIYSFHRNLANVKLNGKWNVMDRSGNFISPIWFDRVSYYAKEWMEVELDGKLNFINRQGELLNAKWFETHESCSGKSGLEYLLDGVAYQLDENGKPIPIPSDSE